MAKTEKDLKTDIVLDIEDFTVFDEEHSLDSCGLTPEQIQKLRGLSAVLGDDFSLTSP